MGQYLSSSSSAPSSAPSPPPALLSAAVIGDYDRYLATYTTLVLTSPDCLSLTDSQSNNVLHAAFSCANPAAQSNVLAILDHVHLHVPSATLSSMYSARNQLGCNPLWICVAYGNVAALTKALSSFPDLGQSVHVSNLQGDTSILATCSKGNQPMLEYLHLSSTVPNFVELLQKGNKNGTTPLQILVANSHLDALSYILDALSEAGQSAPLLQLSAKKLSLFHVAAERGFDTGLQLLLKSENLTLAEVLNIKDANGANALHVAAFCGNIECVKVFPEAAVQKGESTDLLDLLDGEGRSAYWLAMLKGYKEVGDLLKEKGGGKVGGERMEKEIEEAEARREEGRRKKAEISE
jgi:ankyrin repeat protein